MLLHSPCYARLLLVHFAGHCLLALESLAHIHLAAAAAAAAAGGQGQLSGTCRVNERPRQHEQSDRCSIGETELALTCERLQSLTASCSVAQSSGTPAAFFLAHCLSSALPAPAPFDLKHSEPRRQSTHLSKIGSHDARAFTSYAWLLSSGMSSSFGALTPGRWPMDPAGALIRRSREAATAALLQRWHSAARQVEAVAGSAHSTRVVADAAQQLGGARAGTRMAGCQLARKMSSGKTKTRQDKTRQDKTRQDKTADDTKGKYN